MSYIRSSLSRHLGRTATSPEDIERLAAAAWHKRGYVLLHPEEIADPWERRIVQNLAERKFGKRKEQVSA